MRFCENLLVGASLTLALSSGYALAQQPSQGSPASPARQQTTSPQKTKPATPKSPKVWTDDDIGSVRTPADDYLDQERAQAEQAAAANAAAGKQAQEAAAKPASRTDAPPALSNPKSVESADKMIAWEQRDLDAQKETLNQLQKQLQTAPDSAKPNLQDQIQKSMRLISETQKEKDALEAQKQDLQKKAASSKSVSGQSQSQN